MLQLDPYLFSNGIYFHDVDTCLHFIQRHGIFGRIYCLATYQTSAYIIDSQFFAFCTCHDDGIALFSEVHPRETFGVYDARID